MVSVGKRRRKPGALPRSMSAVLRRDDHGVLLRYADPSVLRPHHAQQRPQIADRERMQLLRAERACLTIRIIGEHVLSDLGMSRLLDELHTIQRALNSKRPSLGLRTVKAEEAAA
jgi:hypothetical protein